MAYHSMQATNEERDVREREYDVVFEVRVNKQLTDRDRDRLREAMLKALDDASLPFNADVVTSEVLVR